MLIILGGLPGVGKTAVARELARQTGAVHVRIDSIEQAMRQLLKDVSLDDFGYRVAYAVAEDNLRVGRIVIADCVNPLHLTRAAWRAVAERSGVRSVEVELVCRDEEEHRRRVEGRAADIRGMVLPTWMDVAKREYEAWEGEHLIIDTARMSVEDSVATIWCAADC